MAQLIATNEAGFAQQDFSASASYARTELPAHVLRERDLNTAAHLIMDSDCNGVVVSGRSGISSYTIDILSRQKFEESGNFDQIGFLATKLAEIVKLNNAKSWLAADTVDHISKDFIRIEDEIRAIADTLSAISSNIHFRIYNGLTGLTSFHDDKKIVAVRTLAGPSTLFLDNNDAWAGRNNHYSSAPDARLYSHDVSELLIFRGAVLVNGIVVDGFSQGLIHKAPDYSGLDRIFFGVIGNPDVSKLRRNS